jgi:hypothetical protein
LAMQRRAAGVHQAPASGCPSLPFPLRRSSECSTHTLGDIDRNPPSFDLRLLTVCEVWDEREPLCPLPFRFTMQRVPKDARPSRGEPSDWPIPQSIWGILSPRWIRALRAFPVAVERGTSGPTIVVAMANPGDLAAIDDIAFAAGMRVKVLPVTQEEIDRAIAIHLDSKGPSASSSESFPVDEESPPVHRS